MALSIDAEIEATAAQVRSKFQPRDGQRYFVEFRAETHYIPIHPGHNYLVHGLLAPDGSIAKESGPVGFYSRLGPIGAGTLGLIANPGTIGPDPSGDDLPVTETYRVPLTSGQYTKLMEFIEYWRQNVVLWNLFFNNCNDFIAGAARAVGLKAPKGLAVIPPSVHIRKLRRLNAT